MSPTASLEDRARSVLETNWRAEGGYTSPHPETYPWQWLWDSCFHALVWGKLEDRRALLELQTLFRLQRPSGFLPHMGYQLDPDAALPLWGVAGASTITQPPMYGHALRALVDWGWEVPPDLIRAAESALDHLWRVRRSANGLLSVYHPWESGCDDSPRWDGWGSEPFDRFGGWRARKLELVAALELDDQGSAEGSRSFVVQPASFNALCAFNMGELALVTGDDRWRARASELARALDRQWDSRLCTWTDGGSGASTRTLESLLGVLVTDHADRAGVVWEQLFDPGAFGASYGPGGVHRAEPAFDPGAYWRGGTWPQLSYLFWLAARRSGGEEHADRIATQTKRGAERSGHAEYWNPDTGAPLGAAPQAWATVWLVMS